jgi:hypothetical protein
VPTQTPGDELPLRATCPKTPVSGPNLDCRDVMAAVIPLTPVMDPSVVRFEFHPGYYCPLGARCSMVAGSGLIGYVVFRTRGEAGDWFVTVAMGEGGTVKVTSGPAPFPPQ